MFCNKIGENEKAGTFKPIFPKIAISLLLLFENIRQYYV